MMISLAAYLGRRLLQCGTGHVFGVPGDFNLTLLDHLTAVPGLRWVGSPNELGAGYAADAYARSKGLGVIVTTYGVGELSCLNAIAGSAAEDVPVVHVAGSPATGAVAAGKLLHHTLADGVFDRFSRAYAEVVVHSETVTADRAASQVDAVLTAALTHRRPAYLSIPQDLAALPVDAGRLSTPLVVPSSDYSDFSAKAASMLVQATNPVLVLGHLVARFGLADTVLAAARTAGIPLVTSIAAKGIVDESDPLYRGDYAGTMVDPSTAALVDAADLVIELGTVATDVLTGFFTHRPAGPGTMLLRATTATIGDTSFPVNFPDAVRALAALLNTLTYAVSTPLPAASPQTEPGSRHPAADEAAVARGGAAGAVAVSRGGVTGEPTPVVSRGGVVAPGDDAAEARVVSEPDGPLTQHALWATVQEWLPSGVALLADTGTSYWGAVSLRLPPRTNLVAQPIWNSIGYALPAVLGQGLAEPDRRPVLFIGDGAAQMTVQELSTIAAAGLKPIIVLLNNRGYTIERALQSPDAAYNDIADWDWGALVGALAGPKLDFRRVDTPADLRTALDAAAEATETMALIEVILDRYDAPPLLQALAARNSA